MKNKIFGIFIALGMVVMIAGFIIGSVIDNEYVMIGGFAFCFIEFVILGIIRIVFVFKDINKELKAEAKKARTPEREAELIEEINSSDTVEEKAIAQAKYYGQGAENVGELVQACFGFTKEGKENFKNSSKTDKFKVIAILASFGLLLLTFFIGIFLAGYLDSLLQLIGFIMMGVGGGGFFLVIMVLLIISLVQRHRYFSTRKQDIADIEYKAVICEGTVISCAVHSQVTTGTRYYSRVQNTLYQIIVNPDEEQKTIRFLCSRLYNKGERIKYYRFKNNKRILIEDD